MKNETNIGRISEVSMNSYRILFEGQEFPAKLKGSFWAEDAEGLPVVGDRVAFEYNPLGDSVIVSVCARTGLLQRPNQAKTGVMQYMAANVDYVFIVTSLNNDYSFNRIARYTGLALQGGAVPVVILTKSDLCNNVGRSVSDKVKVHAISALYGIGLDELKEYFVPGKTICLLGSSEGGHFIMSFGFSYIGLIWIIMLLVPNIIWTKNKPADYDRYVINENKVLLALERAGEFIVTPVALMFSDFNFKGWNFWSAVIVLSFLCMVLYEIFWVRYFRSEKTMKDFYSSICGVPVAGATLPVIAFFLLGIYGGNILMLIGSLILGVGHIGIHLQHRKEVYGPKAKKKMPVRIICGILKGIGIFLLVLICGSFIFFIAGRNINQLKHAIAYKDGVNEQIYVTLNDQEEYISIIGKDASNPVIISLHGGPGAPTTYIDYCWQDYLTDDYTVVSWDERGCGRSYYRNVDTDPDNKTLTFEQQLKDLDALTDYLCDRFGQEKVIILGHSYGSMLGSRYVLAHPEKVSAYIGVGQCVNEKDYYGETYSYEDALKIAREQGDDTSEMEKAYAEFMSDKSIANLINLRNHVDKYHPQTVTKDISTMAGLTSPIAGVDDIRWYMVQMRAVMGDFSEYNKLVEDPLGSYMMDFNAFETNDSYQMPVLFISGSCDWVTPVGLVEEYAECITAPKVELYLVEGCGHSPQGQLPEEFVNAVKAFLK